MSTAAQIAANQKNALSSTGPVTETGLKRSSQNAIKHGFTGLSIVVTPQEKDAYEFHVEAYLDEHKPTRHKHIEIVQELADLHWSLHQIFVQQTNTIALMNAITVQMLESGDPTAIAAAIAPVARTLNTLSTYEGRRRRAAKAVQEELAAYEQTLREQPAPAQTQPKTAAAPKIGSVCPVPTQPISPQQFLKECEEMEAFLNKPAVEENAA
jgi:hypothetical protein